MRCQLSWVQKVYNFLRTPDHCLLCLARADHPHVPICNGCQQELPWLLHGCRHCALPLAEGEHECAACQQQHQPFRTVVCAWHYAFPVNMLVGNFKYTRDWPAGRLLGELLVDHLSYLHQDAGLELAELLVPVPLASQRLRQRGYNQALMIAGWLGKPLQRPVLPDAVRRVRSTRIQQGLTARQRQANMHNAFRVIRPQQVAGRHLALVDDVLTTGATCAALASALLEAGARRVDVYCLARTGLADSSG